MTDSSHRTYARVLAVVVFAISLVFVGLEPWGPTPPDPRLAALAQREQRLRADAGVVRTIVALRARVYRVELQARQAQNASRARALQATQAVAAPSVRVVNLPPLTVTRTS